MDGKNTEIDWEKEKKGEGWEGQKSNATSEDSGNKMDL